MKVIIAGGGIGGLTTALMLRARGLNCQLFEQTAEPREIGVGINTLPHAIQELADLGLLDRLDAVAVRTHELLYTNRLGQVIWRELRGVDAGFAVPQFSIHRGRLHGVLHAAAQERLGSGVHMDCRLVAFEQDKYGVTAHCANQLGGAPAGSARGDVLIGADGIHSAVREMLYPNQGPALLGRHDDVAHGARLAVLYGRAHYDRGRRHEGEGRPVSDRAGSNAHYSTD